MHREQYSNFQGHRAGGWYSQSSTSGSWAPEPMFTVTATSSLVQAEDLNQQDLVVEWV